MKRQRLACYGLASAMALSIALPAQAADIYRGEGGLKDPAPVEYVPSITWTGFYLGGHLGATWDDSDEVEIVDDAVFTGGGHLGFNWQGPSNIVLGIEGDVSFMDDIDYLATIRGRLGYAFGPTMAYITGGGAYIELGDFDDTGWVAGGGFEHKLRQNVSFGVEGLYHDFEGDDDFGDAAFWTARARLTYHFGGARN